MVITWSFHGNNISSDSANGIMTNNFGSKTGEVVFISYYATDTVKHGGGRQVKIEIFLVLSLYISYTDPPQRSPSVAGFAGQGTLLRRMEAFPRIKRREILDRAWLVHSLSSRPVCLAIACAIFDTSFSAVECQPPRDSKARGRKATPCLSQSSPTPAIFRWQAGEVKFLQTTQLN